MEDLFAGFNASQYDEEARRQWGDSEAFAESERRTRRYRPDDWKALAAEQAAIYDDAHAALKAGKSASDAAVMDVAERHRLSIDRWFYPCSHAMHRGLASMFQSDERFRQSIDKHGEGLTMFLADGSGRMPHAIATEVRLRSYAPFRPGPVECSSQSVTAPLSFYEVT